MTTTMISYAFTWTGPDGRPHASAVAYDRTSANRRRTELKDAGCTDIVEVPVKPGELPAPRT